MKSKKFLSATGKIITQGCVYYTIISLLLYAGGLLFSTIEREWIPTFDMLLLLLLFTVFFAATNKMVLHPKLPLPVKLPIHYLITGLIFYIVFVWWGGFADQTRTVIVTLVGFTLVYGIGVLIFFLIRYIRDWKENSRTEYDEQFQK